MMTRGLKTNFSSVMAPAQEDFLRLGAMAEEALKNSVKALATQDELLARRVAENDQMMDDLEAAIEHGALRLIALHGPMLQDLREAAFLLKAITDLERIGDLSGKIARNALEVMHWPPMKQAMDLLRMGEISSAMLKEVLDAYVGGNEDKAHAACTRDEEIDQLHRDLTSELLHQMNHNPASVMQASHLLVICQSLERVADHVTNLGERTVYVLTGKKPRY